MEKWKSIEATEALKRRKDLQAIIDRLERDLEIDENLRKTAEEKLVTALKDLAECWNSKSGTDKPDSGQAVGGGGDSEDNSKCPLCGHTYADKSDNSDHNKHFYEEHFFDHFANPEKTEASGAAAVENTAQKSAVLVDEYRDPRYFEDVPDRRKPFLIKCQYPSLEPCPEQWKSNSYPSIDGLRAKMDAHQKSHVNSDSTSQEPLEKLEPDPWTCKMCLHKRKKRDSQEEEDRTRYSTLSWKNVAANHIEAVHKNIKTLILQPETMWISKKLTRS